MIYVEKKDWTKITAKANEYFNKFAPNDWRNRNDLAWSYFKNKNIQDKKLLKSALKWTEEPVSLKEEYMNTDTYAAALLYKLKMYKKLKK